MGSTSFDTSAAGCPPPGVKKKVKVVSFDMQGGGKPSTNDPMYASFFATHCRENAAIRAHAYYIDFGSALVGSISEFIVKDQKECSIHLKS